MEPRKIVVFVCNGNIERSVVAEAALRSILLVRGLADEYEVDSYGLQGTFGTPKPVHQNLKEYPEEWAAARSTLERLQLDISGHLAQQLTPEVVAKAHVLIAMDESCLFGRENSLLKKYGEYATKFHLFGELGGTLHDIPDPFGSGDEQLHERLIVEIFSTLESRLEVLLEWLR